VPTKTAASIKSKKPDTGKKLPVFMDNRKIFLLAVVIFAASIVGAYKLRQGSALGQLCSATSSSCAPTALKCAKDAPTLREGMARNGCVAALQAFYNKGFGLTFVTIDGIYGPNTRNVTRLYEATEINSNAIRPNGSDVTAQTWHKVTQDCYRTGRPAGYCAQHYTYR
jgi:hypothetical protein